MVKIKEIMFGGRVCECGKEVKFAIKIPVCHNCGQDLEFQEEFKFCPQCGEKLDWSKYNESVRPS